MSRLETKAEDVSERRGPEKGIPAVADPPRIRGGLTKRGKWAAIIPTIIARCVHDLRWWDVLRGGSTVDVGGAAVRGFIYCAKPPSPSRCCAPVRGSSGDVTLWSGGPDADQEMIKTFAFFSGFWGIIRDKFTTISFNCQHYSTIKNRNISNFKR